MIMYKLHKRSTVRVEQPEYPGITDAQGEAMMIMYDAINEIDLEPGDVITIDVRILVERRET